jgi:hypothetical protein
LPCAALPFKFLFLFGCGARFLANRTRNFYILKTGANLSPRSSTSSFPSSAARLASNVDEPVSHYWCLFLQLPDDTSAPCADTILPDDARRKKNKNNASYSGSRPTPLETLTAVASDLTHLPRILTIFWRFEPSSSDFQSSLPLHLRLP